MSKFDNLDPGSVSATELTPRSDILSSLYTAKAGDRVSNYLLYGDIGIKISQKLFNLELEMPVWSMGDLVVSARSASSIGRYLSAKQYEFKSEAPLLINRVVIPNVLSYEVRFVIPDFGGIKYSHTEIIKQESVKLRIRSILLGNYE